MSKRRLSKRKYLGQKEEKKTMQSTKSKHTEKIRKARIVYKVRENHFQKEDVINNTQ